MELRRSKELFSTHAGVLKGAPYGFASRFKGGPSTTPEELVGAAHASCFTKANRQIVVSHSTLLPASLLRRTSIGTGVPPTRYATRTIAALALAPLASRQPVQLAPKLAT